MTRSSIGADSSTIKKLELLKIIPRETLEDVVLRLIKYYDNKEGYR